MSPLSATAKVMGKPRTILLLLFAPFPSRSEPNMEHASCVCIFHFNPSLTRARSLCVVSAQCSVLHWQGRVGGGVVQVQLHGGSTTKMEMVMLECFPLIFDSVSSCSAFNCSRSSPEEKCLITPGRDGSHRTTVKGFYPGPSWRISLLGLVTEARVPQRQL